MRLLIDVAAEIIEGVLQDTDLLRHICKHLDRWMRAGVLSSAVMVALVVVVGFPLCAVLL